MPDLGHQPARPFSQTHCTALALAAALVAAMLGACPAPQDTSYERDILVFGTLAHLTLYGVPEPRAAALADAVDARLQEMHRSWHSWQPSG